MRFEILIFFTCLVSISNAQKSLVQVLDSIVLDGIDSMAYPGAQLIVYHQDSVIAHKSYGFHTYDRLQSVALDHVYDLASITKVISGLPVLMKLYDKGLFDLDVPAGDYISDWKETEKENLTFREILAHQAGLQPYIVFWSFMKNDKDSFKRRTVKSRKTWRFPITISDELYLHRKYKKKMWKQVVDSPLSNDKVYRYSGLSFLKMPELIEGIIVSDFNTQLLQTFYKPLNADRLRYNPWQEFPLHKIVPTERDTFFRNTLVHGHVHDEAAAMLDGVSCNAGLFGNAESVAKMFLMYMNKGIWEDRQYISSSTIKEFTSYQYPENDNRRGLGFDKPPLEYIAGESYIAKSASPSSFGHSGFTGTFAWADPEHELLIVFLSNRVHPNRSQRKLYTMNIRPKLHQILYDYLVK